MAASRRVRLQILQAAGQWRSLMHACTNLRCDHRFDEPARLQPSRRGHDPPPSAANRLRETGSCLTPAGGPCHQRLYRSYCAGHPAQGQSQAVAWAGARRAGPLNKPPVAARARAHAAGLVAEGFSIGVRLVPRPSGIRNNSIRGPVATANPPARAYNHQIEFDAFHGHRSWPPAGRINQAALLAVRIAPPGRSSSR